VRPFALDCLKKANESFEVAVYTAGHDWYANAIIDYLDPDGSLIQHRFYRQHCTFIELEGGDGFFVKDLRILQGIDLSQVLIVDNFVYSFAFHLENGVPIVPFFGNKDDIEMLRVARYLSQISYKKDIRSINDKVFQLKKIYDSHIESYISFYD